MSIVKKTQGNHKTFKELCNVILNSVLLDGGSSKRMDVVFDVYKEDSIKNAERIKRADTGSARYNNILPNHKIKQWQLFLADGTNKTNFIRFLCNEWKTAEYRTKLGSCCLYIAYDNECFKLTATSVEAVDSLSSTHEEADTRILLHTKHASDNNYAVVVIHCEDTDVLTLAMSSKSQIRSSIYLKRGSKTRTRYVKVDTIHNTLGDKVANALLGLHAVTGCDTVSAFAGKGKSSAFKLVQRSSAHCDTLSLIGQH